MLRKREKGTSPTSALLIHAHAPWILYGFPQGFSVLILYSHVLTHRKFEHLHWHLG